MWCCLLLFLFCCLLPLRRINMNIKDRSLWDPHSSTEGVDLELLQRTCCTGSCRNDDNYLRATHTVNAAWVYENISPWTTGIYRRSDRIYRQDELNFFILQYLQKLRFWHNTLYSINCTVIAATSLFVHSNKLHTQRYDFACASSGDS